MSFNEVYYAVFFAGAALYGCIILLSFARQAGPLLEIRCRLEHANSELSAAAEKLQDELNEKKPELQALIEEVVELRETRDQLQEQYFELTKDRPEEDDSRVAESKLKKVER